MPKPFPRLKPLTFLGSSRDDLRDMSAPVRHAIYVLHAFQKKTQKTAKADLELAKRRYKLIPGAKP